MKTDLFDEFEDEEEMEYTGIVDSSSDKAVTEMLDLSDKLEEVSDNPMSKDALAYDPFASVKESLFKFINHSLYRVTKEQVFLSQVKTAILKKIDQDELSPSQLINLYRTISEETTTSTQSILNIFMPTKDGAVSPLIDRNSSLNQKPSSEESGLNLENLSKEDKRAIHKLIDLMEGTSKD